MRIGKRLVRRRCCFFSGRRPPIRRIHIAHSLQSGLRIRTAEGAVYHLQHEYSKHLLSDSKYFFAPYRASLRWEDLVQKVAADAAEMRHIRSLKTIPDLHRRNEALLDWVERHRAEFGAGLTMDEGEEPSHGWGSLEVDVFQWVFESGIPTDCWAAVKQYAELNHGNNPWLRTPAFGTAAGAGCCCPSPPMTMPWPATGPAP